MPLAHTIAQVALELDAFVGRGASGSTGLFQVRRQFLEERRVIWQPEDDRDGLAAAPGFLDAKLGHRADRYGFAGSLVAAAAALGLPAATADLACRARVDGPDVAAIFHRFEDRMARADILDRGIGIAGEMMVP